MPGRWEDGKRHPERLRPPVSPMQTDPAATPTKTCRYCAETDLAKDAIVCKHCGKDIGPGSGMKEVGQNMQAIGCALTLLITVPIVLMVLLASAC